MVLEHEQRLVQMRDELSKAKVQVETLVSALRMGSLAFVRR